MPEINQEWHDNHKMPTNPTPMEKISWHEAHHKFCDCTPIPQSILKHMPPSAEQT